MPQMIDTEGAEIPKSEDGSPYFDAHLCDWNEGNGPDLSINVPPFFEGVDGADYDSCGILTIPIQAVFEEYLNEFQGRDGGAGVPAFVEWLRDYANRLEAANTPPST